MDILKATIAYFSMEIALESSLPTYSGGLGVLAGDTLRSAADTGLPLVGVTLVHRKGYFHQRIDERGVQIEKAVEWVLEEFLADTGVRTSVELYGEKVEIRIWRYLVQGIGRHVVPVFLLDTDLPENSPPHRELTHYLYGKGHHYRLAQEVVLGIGGVRALRALGFNALSRFHMNEGHASLLTLELVDEVVKKKCRLTPTPEDIAQVKQSCVFTTHTPVPAGHDRFALEDVTNMIGHQELFDLPSTFCHNGELNMTYLGFNMSHYINGVARKHGEVSRQMFAPYTIDSITNGVHAGTWASAPIAALFDEFMPNWRKDNFSLRYAESIPVERLLRGHEQNKRALLQGILRESGEAFALDVFTIGFARRMTPYKRADLLLLDIDSLKQIARTIGPLQIVYAGKAHPNDGGGKDLIQKICEARTQLLPEVRLVYLSNYDMSLGKLLTAGVDVWLNTPEPPLEASGTSGMKAALNGVPSLSILDGWWIEGCIEDVTGWAISPRGSELAPSGSHSVADARALYERLEKTILPLYYNERLRYAEVMRHAIALNGSFFNTERMLREYMAKAYFADDASLAENFRA